MHNKITLSAQQYLQINPVSVWLTGLSGSGKTTLAKLLANWFSEIEIPVKVLDGDDLRRGINSNLGYSMTDRYENIRRAAEVSKLFNESGISTINAFICPTIELRQMAKKIIGEKSYLEIFLDVPVEICENRDPKGLYDRFRKGEFKGLTGKDSPYEIPENPHFIIKAYNENPEDSAKRTFESILGYICSLKKINKSEIMDKYHLTHLKELESESIYVIREVAAQFERPCLLFSGGKDSIVMFYLARKAFWPSKVPFPLLHIDTGHNFQETLDFRDNLMQKTGAQCIVRLVQDTINAGKVVEEKGPNASRNYLQSVTLDAIEEFKFDAALGGGRRDEEKARAKERFFSHRDEFGQWDPKNQRPELWNIFNGKKRIGEHFRVFPLSNWTEMDIWQYIYHENIEMPSLYFTHEREVIIRDNNILANSDVIMKKPTDIVKTMRVRFRTIGDLTCTGAVESPANSIEDIIEEVAASRVTERGGRADDKRSESAMEDRKKEGYF